MRMMNKNNLLRLLMLFMVTAFLCTSTGCNEAVSDVQAIEAAPEIASSMVKSELPDFSSIADVKEKKKRFFNYIRPMVEAENERILEQRVKLLDIYDQYMYRKYRKKVFLSEEESAWLKGLKGRYRVSSKIDDPELIFMELIRRVDVLPVELALTQAAKESGWGSSRFARFGNNIFGQQCFVKGCGLVPINRNKGAIHEVRKFESISASVRSYIRNLNTNSAYEGFRQLRYDQRQAGKEPEAYPLVAGLPNYSERGEAYLEEIRAMILANMPIMGS